MATINPDETLRNSSLYGATQTVKDLLDKNACSEQAKLYAMYNAILLGYDEIVKLLLDNDVSPTANDGAVLRVLKFCKHDKVIALFKDYLK